MVSAAFRHPREWGGDVALITVTNLTPFSLDVPAPLGRVLGKYKSATVAAPASSLSSLTQLTSAGLIHVVVAEDPTTPNVLEPVESSLAAGAAQSHSFRTLSEQSDDVHKVPVVLAAGSSALVEVRAVCHVVGEDVFGAHCSRAHVVRAPDGAYAILDNSDYLASGSGRVNIESDDDVCQIVFEGLPMGSPIADATGSITFPERANIGQGDFVTLSDGDAEVSFVFDMDDTIVETSNVRKVLTTPVATDEEHCVAFVTAVNAAQVLDLIQITAVDDGATATLTNVRSAGVHGNEAITVTGFTPIAVSGMSGGTSAYPMTLMWSAGVSILKV